jgi:RNA polymerase sigma-54 factor
MELGTGLYQQQTLRMSQATIMSLKLMEMPLMELRESISAELEKNPALELLGDKRTVSLDRVDREIAGSRTPADRDALFGNTSDPGWTSHGRLSGDEKQAFIEGVLTRPDSLQDMLLWQLRMRRLPPEILAMGETLIQNLDGDGFNYVEPAALFPGKPAADVAEALAAVRGLDPPGCATSGYAESLCVQAELAGGIVAKHFTVLFPFIAEIEHKKLQKVEKAAKLGQNDIQAWFAEFKKLSPFPGRQFSGGRDTVYVAPDVKVLRKENDAFAILINNEEIPVLGVSDFFEETAHDKSLPKDARDFARENVRDAKWFINTISRRTRTLYRLTRAIVRHQRGFFLEGPKGIKPLTLHTIAEELELNESTISRAANSKYVQTEWGIYELRYFFTTAIHSHVKPGKGPKPPAEEDMSRTAVKEILKEIIAEESKSGKHPSDNALVKKLEERGVKIARRTVAKYRGELDLGSSYDR